MIRFLDERIAIALCFHAISSNSYTFCTVTHSFFGVLNFVDLPKRHIFTFIDFHKYNNFKISGA